MAAGPHRSIFWRAPRHSLVRIDTDNSPSEHHYHWCPLSICSPPGGTANYAEVFCTPICVRVHGSIQAITASGCGDQYWWDELCNKHKSYSNTPASAPPRLHCTASTGNMKGRGELDMIPPARRPPARAQSLNLRKLPYLAHISWIRKLEHAEHPFTGGLETGCDWSNGV